MSFLAMLYIILKFGKSRVQSFNTVRIEVETMKLHMLELNWKRVISKFAMNFELIILILSQASSHTSEFKIEFERTLISNLATSY